MAEYQVSIDEDLLQHLFSGKEGLGRLVEAVLNQVLSAQVTEQVQAAPYERTVQRQGYRNGTRERQLTTRVGTLTLQVPQVRGGEFSTELFARYQRSEQALVLALLEMVINGVSTRKVRRITEELCGTSVAKSTVSDLCQRLDPIVRGWNERDLSAQPYPFLVVDALVVKVRHAGRVRQMSALLAIGVNAAGYREVLGVQLGQSENEGSWADYFAWLAQRGLHGVEWVVSDQHQGLVAALGRHFAGASWQRCQTHFMRNLLDAAPKSLHEAVHQRVRRICEAPDPETARRLLQEVLVDLSPQAPQAMAKLEEGFEDAVAVLALPEPYRKRLRTTNGVERLNQELRRRERVIRIFPNQTSAERLLGAVLMEIDEEWTTGRRYFDMTAYWEWHTAQQSAQAPTKKGEQETAA